MTKAVPPAHSPYRYRAPYAESDRFRSIDKLCADTLDIDALHHVSFYVDGVLGLSFDLLDHTEIPVVQGRSARPERRRRDLESFGRQVNRAIEEANRILDQLDTGLLIRVVFDTGGSGGLFYGRINARQYLVGATLNVDAVKAADEALGTLTTKARALLGLPSLNPGGREPTPRRERSPHQVTAPVPQIQPGAGDGDRRFADLGRGSVRSDDLHYVARCRDGRTTVTVDVFDHIDLQTFFLTVGVKRRRDLLESVGRGFPAANTGLLRAVRAALGSPPVRTVFDVEAGAIYFHHADDGTHLIGVTLDQQRVDDADGRFEELVHRFLESGRPQPGE